MYFFIKTLFILKHESPCVIFLKFIYLGKFRLELHLG